MSRAIFGICYLLFGLTAFSADQSMTDTRQLAEPIIVSLHAEMLVEDYVEGDLDNDGVADIAYLACNNDANECVLGVLRSQKQGGPVPWGYSKPFSVVQRRPEIAINKRSLFVSTFRNSLTEAWGIEIQYQYRNGAFLAIGKEEFYYSPAFDEDPGPKLETRISTNYLTRVEIRTEKRNKKVIKKQRKYPVNQGESLSDYLGS